MSFSIGGGKSTKKEKGTVDQTTTNTISGRGWDALQGGLLGLQNRSYTPVSASRIGHFQDPYKRDVIDASLAQADQSDAQAWAGMDSRLAQSGAFGDKRRGVMEAELAGTQSRDRASMIAGLNSQNYAQALAAAMAENQGQNQYDLGIQDLIARLLSQQGSEGTSRTNGVTTGRSTGTNIGFTFSPYSQGGGG